MLRQVGTCQSLVTLGQRVARRAEEHGIPAVHALHLAELVHRWGIAKKELLRGIVAEERLADPEAVLGVATVEKLVARARLLTGEPAIGFHLGLQMRISAHGYLGFAAMASSTLRDAIELASRFAPTRTSALALELVIEGNEASLVVHERADFGTARDAVLLALLVGIWQIGNAVTGRELGGRAQFAFPEPSYAKRLASMAPRAAFARASNCLVFDAALLELPLTMADPVALQLAREQCERALDALGQARVVTRVRELVAKRERGFRSLEEVAAELSLSARTLKRRLAEQGVAFSTLLEEERRDRALLLLRSPELSIDEIADRLGYSDVANFGRAFRRWTGTTPAARRKQLLG